jgi:prepilin-type N-terminal cleavage/methylation domain-containing protein
MKKLMHKKGYTIIEVIIVLVVGAVIMLAVFLVIPQLQQSARNNQRTRDAQRVLTAVRQYYSQFSFPGSGTDITGIVQNIVGTPFNDPNLKQQPSNTLPKAYTIKARPAGGRTAVSTWIEVFLDRKCKTNQSSAALDDNLEFAEGSFAVTLDLEPQKPALVGGNYYGRSHYCISG